MRLSFKRRHYFLFLGPAITVLLALVVFPTLYVLNLSFRRFSLTNPAAGRPFIGLENFQNLLTSSSVQGAVGKTLLFTVGSVLLTLLLGGIIALLLNRKDLFGTTLTQTLILIPIILTPLVTGATFRFLLNYDNGLINEILSLIGLERIPFLAKPGWAMFSVILADVWQWTPFAALVLLAGLQALPVEPFEAAEIDGASPAQSFWYITVPLLRPVIAVVLLLRTMDAFREFDKIFIMTSGGPGDATETLSVYVWRAGFQNFNMGYAAAVGVVMLIGITLISMYYVKRIHRVE